MYLLEIALIWIVFFIFNETLLWALYASGEEPQHPVPRFIAGRATTQDLPIARSVG